MNWRERLQAQISKLGLTRAEVTRRAGVGPTAIRDIIDRDQTPSVENLSKIARAVGMTLSQLYDGHERADMLLTVSGLNMWSELHGRHQKIVPISFFDEETVGVEVSTDELMPNYRRGDILCGPKSSGPYISNYVGLDCIAQTTDGQRLVGILTASAKIGAFDMRSFDPRRNGSPACKLEWAAPIRLILRGR